MSPARAAAWRALCRLETGRGKFEASLAGLPELDALDARDRALATELVTGSIKRRASLDAVLGTFTKAPLSETPADVRTALRLATFQLLFLDRVPPHAIVDDAVSLLTGKGRRTQGFANAVLRQVATRGRARFAELSSDGGGKAWAVRYSCPVWVIRLLREELGDTAAERFLRAANDAPERCLRVNTLRGSLSAAEAALAGTGAAAHHVAGLPEALLYDGPALERSAAFRAGLVTPQSRGSQLAGLVATEGAPAGARVLDLCAAPGTKTCQLAAALPGSRITAVELDERRLAELRANMERMGVRERRSEGTAPDARDAAGVELIAGDVLELPSRYDAMFDVVLLDAPCSGLGTLASRADLRWRRRAADVPRLAALQRRLLARAARCVRPGGTLTYAVCTLPRSESVDVVTALIGDGEATTPGEWRFDDLGASWPALAHPELPVALRVLPPDFGTTGFFIARLRRRPQ